MHPEQVSVSLMSSKMKSRPKVNFMNIHDWRPQEKWFLEEGLPRLYAFASLSMNWEQASCLNVCSALAQSERDTVKMQKTNHKLSKCD